ncbi:hypothetical protein B296_00040283, partial [Ensete ventricosum]
GQVATCGHNARGRAYGPGGCARRGRQPAGAATQGQQRPTTGRGDLQQRAAPPYAAMTTDAG